MSQSHKAEARASEVQINSFIIRPAFLQARQHLQRGPEPFAFELPSFRLLTQRLCVMEAVKGETGNCLGRKKPKMKLCLAAIDTSSALAQVPLGNRFLGENVVGFDSAYRCCLRTEEDRAGNSK